MGAKRFHRSMNQFIRQREGRQRSLRSAHRLQMELLEPRQLLAVGPQLVAINPNEGDLFDITGGSTVLNIAPRELTIRFDSNQVIDPASVEEGIRLVRSNFNGTDFSNPILIEPGFVGIGEAANEVVVRFTETLPDDNYQLTLDGTGADAILNDAGEAFNNGVDRSVNFRLNPGALVTAVVPQPVSRDANGDLVQARDQIVVYFNNDDLDPVAASNPAFYQLIFTNNTVESTDDDPNNGGVPHVPISVVYDSVNDMATLTFADNIDELEGTGTYRLRIGTAESRPETPVEVQTFEPLPVDPTVHDANSSFDTATDLTDEFGFSLNTAGTGEARSIIITAEIDVNLHEVDYPGADDEPGHRDIPVESHLGDPIGVDPADFENGDLSPGIEIIPYNFRDIIGSDIATGAPFFNVITETQKQRAREIFEYYSTVLGVEFVETLDQGLTVSTGDMRAVAPILPPFGAIGIAGGATLPDGTPIQVAIMGNANEWNDERGESDDPDRLSWFATAMHEIGHLLGLGHTGEIDGTVMNGSGGGPEVFPSDQDIVHGQHIHRPESNDIDLYRFEVQETGLFTAETLAERQLFSTNDHERLASVAGPDVGASSFLNTALALYRENPDGSREVIARNDDYFSEDSYLELMLTPGTYFIGVSSTGNVNYDPTISDTGLGGTSDGPYDLRMGFRPQVNDAIVDTTGIALDGDADGVPGGVYNFWFRAAPPTGEAAPGEARTIFVDKSAPSGGDGSLANPLNNINGIANSAFSASKAGDIIRIVGNGGADGNMATIGDNQPYAIGINYVGQALSDGANMNVPRGVTVMVDAGAIFKMGHSTIDVGSSAATVNRSGATLQLLGTPVESVYFTSYSDDQTGVDIDPRSNNPNSPLATPARPGDWGGIIFQSDIDRARNRNISNTDDRFDYEAEGIFLNYVNHVDMRYGGGRIVRNSVEQSITPIHMIDSRPTISFNTITLSASAALSANPNSFEESNFHGPDSVNAHVPDFNISGLQDGYQQVSFTSDYKRVGPDIHFNELVGNTTNGLFIRTRTPAGNELLPLSVVGRFDDTDVVHVITDTLLIRGSSFDAEGFAILGAVGGRVINPATGNMVARPDAQLVIDPGTIVKLDSARIESSVSTQLIAEGQEGQEIIFTSLRDDRYGFGGTFDTNGDHDPLDEEQNDSVPAPGDWGGLYFGNVGSGSVDHARFYYGGGRTVVEGSFASFNVIEVQQSHVRIANSLFSDNDDGHGGQIGFNRGGRGFNDEATIFVHGAQPVMINNIIRDSYGAAININVNSLNHFINPDWGRSTGEIDLLGERRDNHGPFVFNNRMVGNDINGMVVRGEGILTTQSVWDDTDIVHVVFDTIEIPDYHTYGGLRLESRPQESLVVKLSGTDAGFLATGQALDIDDRLGGAVQVVGQPGYPVVLTSLGDSTVGAGFEPDGTPQRHTKGDGFPERTEPEGSFRIDVNYGPTISNNPAAIASFDRAIRFIEGLFQDPITVHIDVDFFIVTGGEPALGVAIPETVALPYNQIRTQMIADAGEHEPIVNDLPTPAQLTATFADDTQTLGSNISLTRANALALGIANNLLPQNASIFDANEITDGLIALDNVLNVANANIFGVALHEVIHTLGFVSNVPELVSAGAVDLTTLDLFRLSPGAGGEDFTNSPRIMDPGMDQVFYDGGVFRPTDIPIDTLRKGDIPLSTGRGPDGDGSQPSHWKSRDLIDGITLGVMDPAGGALSDNDKRALDLIGWDAVTAGIPGDWEGITLDQFSGDRNVKVVTEYESAGLEEPGSNSTPNDAQFVGALAPHEKGGDDILRLGYEIHGFLSTPGDVDVYSFTADAGTEVWIDIDRTSQALDSVVELIDAEGNVLARSDNSYYESLNVDDPLREERFYDPDVFTVDAQRRDVNGLSESLFVKGKDHFTINVLDAGMRVVLPEAAGTNNTYHIRVRSSSDNLDDVAGGLTSGAYQLNLRLREMDEIPGSGIQYADVRYATNGVEVLGQPGHSPLLGEAAEDSTPNNTFAQAQPIGNPLVSDRGAISVAGSLSSRTDVDWYSFILDYEDVQYDGTSSASIVLDMDYSNAIARPDTYVAIYDNVGNLIFSGSESNVADDQPAAAEGGDVDDLERGSFGKRDPFIGPISLPVTNPDGSAPAQYFVAVTSDAMRPAELVSAATNAGNLNPLLRIEPIDSIAYVGDSRASLELTQRPASYGEVVTNNDNAVPWTLGDMTLYTVIQSGSNTTDLVTINPYTGATVNVVGRGTGRVGDLATRSDGALFGMSFNPGGVEETDANVGNFLEFSPGNGATTNRGDDGIGTFILNAARDGTDAADTTGGVGVYFNALEFTGRNTGELLWAVGDRGDHQLTGQFDGQPDVPYPDFYSENILYLFNGDTLNPTTSARRDTDAEFLAGGALTDVFEVGHIQTNLDAVADQLNVLVVQEATRFTGSPVTLIGDPSLPIVHDGDVIAITLPGGGGTYVFEMETGPEAYVDFATFEFSPRDNMRFTLTDDDTAETRNYKFETGSVLDIIADSSQFPEGSTFTLTDALGVSIVFEYDTDGVRTTPGSTLITFTPPGPGTPLSANVMTLTTIGAINAAPFGVTAVRGLGNRITLLGDDPNTGVATNNLPGMNVIRDVPLAGETLIFVEETSTEAQVRTAIRDVFAADVGTDFEISIDGGRMNWRGIESADFTGAPVLLQTVPSDGTMVGTPGVTVGTPVPFGAADTAQELATRIVDAINNDPVLIGVPITATQSGPSVVLDTAVFDENTTTDPPFSVGGQAPGGTITGLAQVGGVLYAVSNAPGNTNLSNAGDLPGGGLFIINPNGDPTNLGDYVETSTDLLGIDFTALVAGPTTLELDEFGVGRYETILFGLDSDGMLYAFDTTGALQPLFVNGQTSVQTDVAGANGLGFSILERNLWHTTTTNRQNTADGHGFDVDVTRTRTSEVNGGPSFYFGNETNTYASGGDLANRFNYDYPGGAHGSLVSNVIDLSAYSSADEPMLYFNYFLDTEDANGNGPVTADPTRDTFRVYIQDNSDTAPLDPLGNPTQGQWHMLATNNSFRNISQADEFDGPFGDTNNNNPNGQNYGNIQELFDNTNGWLQVAIPLSSFAGSDNLRIRFDFSTAGSVDLGNPFSTGSELRAIDASRLTGVEPVINDPFGVDTFLLDPPLFGPGVLFEFDFGHVLAIPTAAGVADHETITLEDASGTFVTFEFVKTGTADPANVGIRLSGFESAFELSAKLQVAIESSALMDVLSYRADSRMNFEGVASLTQSADPGIQLIGLPGTGSGGNPVFVNLEMTDVDVALALKAGLESAFSVVPGADWVKVYNETVYLVGHVVGNPGLLGAATAMAEDAFGVFNAGYNTTPSYRSLDNAHEGVYIDDIVIGLAERGEMVTRQIGTETGNTQFVPNPFLPGDGSFEEVLEGDYQLEIRRAAEYTDAVARPSATILRSFDSNDRLSQQLSIFAPKGSGVVDGQSFTISDGNDDFTFEYEDLNALDGVAAGHVPVYFNPLYDEREMATLIVNTINSVAAVSNDLEEVIGLLDVTASVVSRPNPAGFGPAVATTNRIELFGANVTLDVSNMDVETTTDANALRDFILGPGITPVGDAVLVSGETSAGFFENGGVIGINKGIILSTGDATVAGQQNNDEGSSGFASFLPDADLDNEFGVFSDDSTSLVFDFEVADESDLYFNFVFASEEYNEFANTDFNDLFAFFIDGQNIALVPGTSDPISVNTVNGGNPLGVDPVNEQFYNNNSLTNRGDYLLQFGYDGFTDVFTAKKLNLSAGIHTIKLVIADVSDFLYDSAVFIEASSFSAEPVVPTAIPASIQDWIGDSSRERDQGQIVIENTIFSHSAQFGVVIDAAPRDGEDDDIPHMGPARNLQQINTQRLAPGVTITNNIFAANISGGIDYSGETNAAGEQLAPVPFGRIINNTIYGLGGTLTEVEDPDNPPPAINDVGIRVSENASPTLLNNILANLAQGISVDASSSTTVLGGNLYQGNLQNSNVGLGDKAITLTNSQPLFVDAANMNFYLAAGSRAIDSAIDTLQDRLEMINLRDPLGIERSPILAPDRDLLGQLRADDPTVEPPSGLGGNVFKDRGALDRVDVAGPVAQLVNPRDNDAGGRDQNPNLTEVLISTGTVTQFVIQLSDGSATGELLGGTGADPATVSSASVILSRGIVTLVENVDYTFNYDATNALIRLVPLSGNWAQGTYTILLDNDPDTGIKDIAGNPLKANQTSLETKFTIALATVLLDFGDAPEPYPTLLVENGARHIFLPGFYLGGGISTEDNGVHSPTASGDTNDNGVLFGSQLFVGQIETFTVTASQAGLLDAWIDFNDDGDWNDAGEQVFSSELLIAGANVLQVSIPNTAVRGDTFARFRFSSAGGLSPSGAAGDGEVEDYLVTIAGNPWHNSANPLDVNGDGFITLSDAAALFKELNELNVSDLNGRLPDPPVAPNLPENIGYFDVDGRVFTDPDTLEQYFAITPSDALALVNYLNSEEPATSFASSASSAAAFARLQTAAQPAELPGNDEMVAVDAQSVQQAVLTVDTATAVEGRLLPSATAAMNTDDETSTDLFMSQLAGDLPNDDDLLLTASGQSNLETEYGIVDEPSLVLTGTRVQEEELAGVLLEGSGEQLVDEFFADWDDWA